MKKLLLSFLLFITTLLPTYAQNEDSTAINIATIEKSLVYKKGTIKLTSGNATLKVPKGFKFLDAKQAQYVMKDLWGNPEDLTLLGALVPENKGVLGDDSWLFTINYDGMGFVNDDDAKDLDYDDLLKDIQEDIKNENIERKKLGFPSADLMGWASKPYYDEDKKILHWAKEFHFENETINTLNYDLRVLGRKGVYIISAIAPMKQLSEVKGSINNVISSIEFDKGNTYADFDSDTDSVAAWTIGGLVAGKILAKVGFFALLLKFWKVGFLAIAGGWAAFKRFYKGKKEMVTSDLSKNTASKDSESTEE